MDVRAELRRQEKRTYYASRLFFNGERLQHVKEYHVIVDVRAELLNRSEIRLDLAVQPIVHTTELVISDLECPSLK